MCLHAYGYLHNKAFPPMKFTFGVSSAARLKPSVQEIGCQWLDGRETPNKTLVARNKRLGIKSALILQFSSSRVAKKRT